MSVSLADEFDVLLFDIEGTVCPISFVKDVLFPYALESLPAVLDAQWDAPAFAQYRDAFPEQYRSDRPALEAHVRDLVARDVKAPYLKSLQGHLWLHGYQSGEIRAPLFPDVAPFFAAAHAAGKKIVIYSSGSVPAQKLLFGHTDAQPSDLQPLVSDWFDTVNAGPKTDVASYAAILSHYPDVSPSRWLFLSDNLREVGAALGSGMWSLPVVRPGNAPLPPDHPLSSLAISDFSPESAVEGLALIAARPAVKRRREEVESKFELDGTGSPPTKKLNSGDQPSTVPNPSADAPPTAAVDQNAES